MRRGDEARGGRVSQRRRQRRGGGGEVGDGQTAFFKRAHRSALPLQATFQMQRRCSPPPSPALVARLAALLGAIPTAFPAAAGETPAAAAAGPPPAAEPPPASASPNRRRRSLSTATAQAWDARLGAAEQQLWGMGLGRTRSEPGVGLAAAVAAPSPPLPQQKPPEAAAPAAQPGSPGKGRRLNRSMRHKPKATIKAASPLPPAAAKPAVASPPQHQAEARRGLPPLAASRRLSAAGLSEASARSTPFTPGFLCAAAEEVSPAAPVMAVNAARASTPLPFAASPTLRSRQAGGSQLPPLQRPDSPAPLSPAAAPPLVPLWHASSPPATSPPAVPPAEAEAEAEGNEAPVLPPVMPRKLQRDLLALLRRQRDYVGAGRQVGNDAGAAASRRLQRCIVGAGRLLSHPPRCCTCTHSSPAQQAHLKHMRRLQTRLAKLEAQWAQLQAAAERQPSRQLRLAAAKLESRRPASPELPLLALEGSEPTLGGELLFEATLRPTTAALGGVAAAEHWQQQSRQPSLRGGHWTPPPATPRLPALAGELSALIPSPDWGDNRKQHRQKRAQLPRSAPVSPAAEPLHSPQLPRLPGRSPTAAAAVQRLPSPSGSGLRASTALERLKQVQLLSLEPSRRHTTNSGGPEPPSPPALPPSPGPAHNSSLKALQQATEGGGGASIQVEARAGHAIAASGSGSGGGALSALKLLRRMSMAEQLSAGLRPTTALVELF